MANTDLSDPVICDLIPSDFANLNYAGRLDTAAYGQLIVPLSSS